MADESETTAADQRLRMPELRLAAQATDAVSV
jgi:hypothetical protein